jgi:hypothetical protein
MDDEKYPPLSEFDVIGDVRLRFAVEFERYLEIAPIRSCQRATQAQPRDTHFSEWARARAT